MSFFKRVIFMISDWMAASWIRWLNSSPQVKHFMILICLYNCLYFTDVVAVRSACEHTALCIGHLPSLRVSCLQPRKEVEKHLVTTGNCNTG